MYTCNYIHAAGLRIDLQEMKVIVNEIPKCGGDIYISTKNRHTKR